MKAAKSVPPDSPRGFRLWALRSCSRQRTWAGKLRYRFKVWSVKKSGWFLRELRSLGEERYLKMRDRVARKVIRVAIKALGKREKELQNLLRVGLEVESASYDAWKLSSWKIAWAMRRLQEFDEKLRSCPGLPAYIEVTTQAGTGSTPVIVGINDETDAISQNLNKLPLPADIWDIVIRYGKLSDAVMLFLLDFAYTEADIRLQAERFASSRSSLENYSLDPCNPHIWPKQIRD